LNYFIIVAFLPYWWRFWQCIKKWYKSGNIWQLVNAGKYFSKFGPAITVKILHASKYIDYDADKNAPFYYFFIAEMIQTMFSLYWDYVWDWGLFFGT